jgi:hypothetical protein
MTTTNQAARLLLAMKADPTKRRPGIHTPMLRDRLIEALEEARRKVCVYSGPTCDCKYGLVPGGFEPSLLSDECTGCPELREMIRDLRTEAAVDADASAAAEVKP